jgi:hypothetical protein
LSFFKINFSFDKHTQTHIWSCLKSNFSFYKHTLVQTYSKSYLDMSKIKFCFDKYIQSYICTCLKSSFSFMIVLKVIFRYVLIQVFHSNFQRNSHFSIQLSEKFLFFHSTVGEIPIFPFNCQRNSYYIIIQTD